MEKFTYVSEIKEQMAIARHNRRLLRKLQIGDIIVPMSGIDGFERYEVKGHLDLNDGNGKLIKGIYDSLNKGCTFYGDDGFIVEDVIFSTVNKTIGMHTPAYRSVYREALLYVGNGVVISVNERSYAHYTNIETFVWCVGPRTKAKVRTCPQV